MPNSSYIGFNLRQIDLKVDLKVNLDNLRLKTLDRGKFRADIHGYEYFMFLYAILLWVYIHIYSIFIVS